MSTEYTAHDAAEWSAFYATYFSANCTAIWNSITPAHKTTLYATNLSANKSAIYSAITATLGTTLCTTNQTTICMSHITTFQTTFHATE
jgi:hypothetical protein